MKVSAIVTSYNHAEYLDQRMQSLLGQANLHEIIVVDDCSQDDSLAVLEKYKQLPHVRIIALAKNEGYATACNVGVANASGDYIIFAECDDYCKTDQFATLLSKFAGQPSLGVVYSSSDIVDAEGRFLKNDYTVREKEFKDRCQADCLIPSAEMQMYLAVACVIPNMSAAMFKKELYEKVGGLSRHYKLCADWDFWCRMSRVCNFYYVREPLNYFRTHPTSVGSLSRLDQRTKEILDLIYDHFEKMESRTRSRRRLLFGVGDLLMGLSSAQPLPWLRAFPSMFLASIAHDKLNFLAPFVGIASKIGRLLQRVFVQGPNRK